MSNQKPTPITLAIYRDLRVGMVIVTLMVFVAIVIEQLSATCWQFALSAYYYTSAHSILIAALLALGTLFIMYKGSNDTEDALLTLAGVSALMIAMVPQGRPTKLCGKYDLPSQFEPATQPNVWAVVVALIVGWSAMAVLHWRNHTRHKRSPLGTVAQWIFWVIMALGFVALVFFPNWFYAQIHGIAGFLMLLSFIITVFCAALVVGQEDPVKAPHKNGYKWYYWIIAAVMVVTLIAVVAVHLKHPGWEPWVIWLESAVIIEFALYWAVQTWELWNSPDRIGRLPDDVQRRLTDKRTNDGGIRGFRSDLTGPHDEGPGGWLLPLL
ncbi:hypothetical protein A5753_19465 [Mycobacterium sp. 852002-51971_SCH5477799-a]|uniref:hypothetical protein n=1 Tax=Mycobacterium sp. 852002-51971_SCH5477799-a TaxID=1834106 RepID=UPI0007FBFE62|nr:hypothetical protein [Mycobacterium sp. 852002-51971_SCH5477799-a]OBF61036.1 hypothetical protein A5753_19465 [Mycobacterium sp. 852002-51971_SCH5477799-a]